MKSISKTVFPFTLAFHTAVMRRTEESVSSQLNDLPGLDASLGLCHGATINHQLLSIAGPFYMYRLWAI
jgi:hypothetical protein